MTERVLVTGGAGFIGSHLCRTLLDHGSTVVVLDNFDPFYDRSIKEEGIADLLPRDGFSLIEGDIRSPEDVTAALDGVDVVVHLAARAGVRPSIEDPDGCASVNLAGTVNLLERCRLAGVHRIVFGSSSSVYGDDTPAPFKEDAVCAKPISPYAATKRGGELICHTHAHLNGASIAALRFFTVYGPRQRPDLAIHRFSHLMSEGQSIPQFGDGSTERDYTFVDDIVAGVRSAMDWTSRNAGRLEIFNLGGSRTVRLSRLIELIGEALGVDPQIDLLPPMPGDVRATSADISKSHRILGYTPTTTIEQGIPRFVDWFTNK